MGCFRVHGWQWHFATTKLMAPLRRRERRPWGLRIQWFWPKIRMMNGFAQKGHFQCWRHYYYGWCQRMRKFLWHQILLRNGFWPKVVLVSGQCREWFIWPLLNQGKVRGGREY